MKIQILTDNTAGSHFLAEHGLSYLIETNDKKILFDTGYSDVYLKNARKLGIDIQNEVDTVVLSHGHWDHCYGLQYIQDKTVITHPTSIYRMLTTEGFKDVWLKLSPEELEKKFEFILTREFKKISENLFFLGEIPRNNDFEAQTTYFSDSDGNKDFIPDDSALAAVAGNELLIITGCSHSGICNITEYAKQVTGISNVKAVLGGFHLMENDNQTKRTVDYFKKIQPEKIYPSHCTQLPALAAFYEAFNIRQLKTGMVLEF